MIIIWMGILDDRIIGPCFFPENININGEIYADFLDNTLSDLLEDVPLIVRGEMIFQQDGLIPPIHRLSPVLS